VANVQKIESQKACIVASCVWLAIGESNRPHILFIVRIGEALQYDLAIQPVNEAAQKYAAAAKISA